MYANEIFEKSICLEILLGDDGVDEGFSISEEHPSNTPDPIHVEEEIMILWSDEQFLKQISPIDVTDEGISICSNEEHPLNADNPINVTDDGIVICASEVHLTNEYSPIDVTDVGISIILRFVQF